MRVIFGLSLLFCLLMFFGVASWSTTLVLYPTNPDHMSDGKISGTVNGQQVSFAYQHTHHVESKWNKDFMANYARFAANGPVDVEVTVNTPITTAYLRTIGKDLPFTRNGSTLKFTLPGPGNYYLQLPELNTAGRITYTVFFFVDDLSKYNSYLQSFASARNVTAYGVTSNPSLDQTSAVQSVLNGRGSIYFPPGIYRTRQLTIQSGTTVYLAPGAVLKGTDNYNSNRYIYINGASNVRIAGMGTIDANGHTAQNMATKGHAFDVESCTGVTMEDVIIRDSNSWMLHMRKCDQVYFDNLKLFSGKDGIDPDGTRDMTVERTVIQSIDDAFAIKSKFSGRSCERVTMRDCIVFSCASSLKIGTENYYGVVKDILWDRCDAVDADRGCILYTNVEDGDAPVSNITWRNIRVFNFGWTAETGGAPFQFRNEHGTTVSNILLENVVAYPRKECYVAGPIGVTFRNVIVNGSSNITTQGMSFEGVIWPGITSESKPVVFIQPSVRNQSDFCNGDTVTITVQHPFNRPISQVQLLVNGLSAGIDTTPPYSFTLSGLTPGNHVLMARATDADGAITSTAPYRISIVQPPLPNVRITAGPSVSNITRTSAKITWSTDLAGTTVVEYGPTTAYGTIATGVADVKEHTVVLTGLAPDTVYHYRVKTVVPGHLDAISADATFSTSAANASLRNPGFEDGLSQTAWVRYGVFDSDGGKSFHTAPWYGMTPHSGSYLAGSAASYGKKNGGLYQRVTSGIYPGQKWTFSAWINTYNKGSSTPTNTNCRIGIDPQGGTDPASSNVVWSPRISTQYAWQQVSVTATAQASAMTFFLDAQQNSAVEWNINAFDDCSIQVEATSASIPQALQMPNESTVLIEDKIVAAGTSEIGGAFYIQEDDRSGGIRVVSSTSIDRASRVSVIGMLSVTPNGERCIVADSVDVLQTDRPLPEPVLISNRDLGGSSLGEHTPGVWQGAGLYNTGLLVKCFGRLKDWADYHFYIDDGSELQDGSGYPGIAIDATGMVMPIETYVVVTGISTVTSVNGKTVRAVRPRAQEDIVGLQPAP